MVEIAPLTPAEAAEILEGGTRPTYAPGYPADATYVAAAMVLEGHSEPPWTAYQMIVDGRVVGGLGFFDAPDAEGRVRFGFAETDEARAGGHTVAAVQQLIALAGDHVAWLDSADPRVAEVLLAAGLRESEGPPGLRHFESHIRKA